MRATKRAIDHVAKPDNLSTAFHHIYRHTKKRLRDNPGYDGVTINDFRRLAASEVREISKAIRSKRFQFSPLTSHFKLKPDGRFRVICVPTVKDRVVQRALLEFLSDGDKCGLDTRVSFGFLKGKSVIDAANLAKKIRSSRGWVYKTDITAFFDSLDRSLLRQSIEKNVRFPSLRPLLLDIASTEIQPRNDGEKRKLESTKIKTGRGVRQGMPLSPFFANLFLKDFDTAMIAKGYELIRYADDFVVFCATRADCDNVHAFCKEELGKLGLTIPEPGGSKTHIYEPTDEAEFLGLAICPTPTGYALNVTTKQFEHIRERLREFASLEQLEKAGTTISRYGVRLEGLLAGYLGSYAECDNYNEVEAKLEQYRSAAVARLFQRDFQLDVLKLDARQKWFLSITDKRANLTAAT